MHIFLTHLASVPPVHFLLSTIEVTQLPFHSIMVFNIRLCYHVLSFSCHILSFNPTGLLAVTGGCNVQARFGRSIFSTRAKSCDVTSSHLSRARVSSTAARVFESCCLKGETNKDTQAAQLCAPPECSAWQTQAAQPFALLPCFFLLHFQNVAIAMQLAQGLREGDVDRDVEKRPLDAQFLKVRRPKERMLFQRKAFAKGEAQQ